MARPAAFAGLFFVLGCILVVLWSTVSLFATLKRLLTVGRRAYTFVKKRGTVPEGLLDPHLGEHGYIQLNTIKIHYVSKGPVEAPLMLFVHGFPEFWYSWRHQMKHFAGNYRTVAIDMRGFGDSSKPIGVKNYTMDKLVNDIQEFIEALGYKKCILVGHDWGGLVVWNFTHMYPEMADKMIQCNIPHNEVFVKHVKSSIKQLLMSWYVFFYQIPIFPELSLRSEDIKAFERIFRVNPDNPYFTDNDIELYKYTYSKPGSFNGPVNYYRALFRHGIDLDYPTEKIMRPTLMIWGIHDKALDKEMAAMSAEYAEDYRVRYVEASHWVQQECPLEVNDNIQQFLDGEI